ncbi:GM17572 [Drosophila sechellia]|uniref:GM17572 n=1 Tax=Drosophila sechellia TaxID=7238 RepID=B4IG96_DROSE|nr:GM17572 [Drosophila sechellia]
MSELAALILSTSSSSINAQFSSVEPVAPHRIASHAHQDSRRPIASIGSRSTYCRSSITNPRCECSGVKCSGEAIVIDSNSVCCILDTGYWIVDSAGRGVPSPKSQIRNSVDRYANRIYSEPLGLRSFCCFPTAAAAAAAPHDHALVRRRHIGDLEDRSGGAVRVRIHGATPMIIEFERCFYLVSDLDADAELDGECNCEMPAMLIQPGQVFKVFQLEQGSQVQIKFTIMTTQMDSVMGHAARERDGRWGQRKDNYNSGDREGYTHRERERPHEVGQRKVGDTRAEANGIWLVLRAFDILAVDASNK